METVGIAWSSVALIAIAVITIVTSAVWSARSLSGTRQSILSAVLALFTFALLFLMRQSLTLPEATDPLVEKTVAFVAVLLTFNALIRMITFAVTEFVLRRRNLHVPDFLINLIAWIALLVLGILMIQQIFGVELTGVLVTSTVVSAIIGLALQDTLGNLISGIALQIEFPFRSGDWVEIAGQEGQVVRQNWRTLALRTRDNHYVLVTNGNVAQGTIINYSQPSTVQAQNAYVGVSYSQPPAEVKRVLLEAVRGTDGVLSSPAARAELIKYGDHSVEYRIRYWIDDYGRKPAISDRVLTRVWYGLKRHGMAIPFPIRDVNMRMLTPELEEREAQREQMVLKGALGSLPLLEDFNDEQLEAVAEGTRSMSFTRGETLLREGEINRSLLVLRQGMVRLYVRGPSGSELTVNTPRRGDYFGMMSLLSQEPSPYSLVAEEEVRVLSISQETFDRTIANDAGALEELLRIIRQRRSDLELSLARAAAMDDQETLTGQTPLLKRFSNFLGLYGR